MPTMRSDDSWLPLFPLKTVLFPEGILPLKVFETRYIDMVRECMRRNAPFGVVLIKAGQEVGVAAEPESVGCLAHIASWDMEKLGVMMLRTVGGERFRIIETRVLPDQRLEAQVEMIAPDEPAPVTDMHVACATTLKLVIDDVNAKGRTQQGDTFSSPFSQPARLDSAGWVANRWCELLPIPLKARQKLMELDDAPTRLSIIHQYLQQHKII
ncbi:MAG TPA: LON peptidase substrate-binding domain-containing protein [Noviherbaspirillum sp.]|uniref:LON peptidase substrate-binding domain-containing protein n=1 Tax=Noviherbaspirillum sp. TaxID=1926288 RepID=UPI002B47CAF2|nr:LON peptidase substrate-binding domain-containing protein [Noviherbaspirillum sp.]HJV87978.1 LON peptidase substrate-binding domain-containing protein [Noviherbaspirillum sp.]